MVFSLALPDPVAIVVSILCMAGTIVASAKLVLRRRGFPWRTALVIAAVSNLLGKFFVSVVHWPAGVSYALPTLAFLILSAVFYKPTLPKLVAYWLAGFAMYLGVHLLITTLFGWSFMFPFWAPRLF